MEPPIPTMPETNEPTNPMQKMTTANVNAILDSPAFLELFFNV